jgi:hypothetical protein
MYFLIDDRSPEDVFLTVRDFDEVILALTKTRRLNVNAVLDVVFAIKTVLAGYVLFIADKLAEIIMGWSRSGAAISFHSYRLRLL